MNERRPTDKNELERQAADTLNKWRTHHENQVKELAKLQAQTITIQVDATIMPSKNIEHDQKESLIIRNTRSPPLRTSMSFASKCKRKWKYRTSRESRPCRQRSRRYILTFVNSVDFFFSIEKIHIK